MPDLELPVADLQPGMTLAQDILDENGRTVLQVGSRLTPMLIKRLGKWDVGSVKVHEKEKTAVQVCAESQPSVLASATSEDKNFMRQVAIQIQKRFRNVSGNPLMEEMKRLTVKHLVLEGKGVIPGLGKAEEPDGS